MKEKRGVSGSTLKIIAITVMFIDHCGAAVLERMMRAGSIGRLAGNALDGSLVFGQYRQQIFIADTILRFIGRLGFPIFCFLLIEGFMHTRSVVKYARNLFIFALISEIPFDLAFKGEWIYLGYQNVFFTLLIGLLVMWGYRLIEEKESIPYYIKWILYVVALAAGMVAAQLLKTDYAAIGIVCIMALYITRKNKTGQIITGCLVFLWELTAPLAFIPIGFYNGKRGISLKYAFYAFYPLHLLLLYLFRLAIGIA